jgi:hypothetical protein
MAPPPAVPHRANPIKNRTRGDQPGDRRTESASSPHLIGWTFSDADRYGVDLIRATGRPREEILGEDVENAVAAPTHRRNR